jgi:hypothetical protein
MLTNSTKYYRMPRASSNSFLSTLEWRRLQPGQRIFSVVFCTIPKRGDEVYFFGLVWFYPENNQLIKTFLSSLQSELAL